MRPAAQQLAELGATTTLNTMQRLLLIISMALCLGLNVLQARITYPHQWQQLPSHQLLDKAQSYSQADHLDSAMLCYSIVASRLSKDNKNEKHNYIKALYSIGTIYFLHYYNYQKAADVLLLAKKEAETANDSVILPFIYNSLGALYSQFDQKDYSQTKHYLKLSYRYTAPNTFSADMTMFNLVLMSIKFGFYQEITSEIEDYLRHHPEPNMVTYVCHSADDEFHGKYDKAISEIDLSLNHVETEDKALKYRFIGCLLFRRCQLLDKAGRDAESLAEARRYEQLVREHGFMEGLPEIYWQYYKFYSSRGNQKMAHENQLRYYILTDSLNAITNVTYINKASFVLDLQNAQAEVKIQALKRERLTQILWIVTIAAIIFMVLMLMLWRRNKQLRERNQALYDQSLQQLAIIDEARKSAPPVQAPMPVEETKPETDNEPSEIKAEIEPSLDVVDHALEEVFQRVKAVLESSPEIYNEDFSLSKLHVLIGGNIKNISRAIGTYAHCDLKALLSQYRIREACRRMNDVEHYGNYTIEAIAKSVGVTSRTSFVQNFKRQTGLTPSAYLKLARNKQA